MALRRFYLFICLSLFFQPICLAQVPSASQVTRSQELIQQQEDLTSKLKDTKVFVEEIIISGADSLSQDEIEELSLPFQNHWMGREDIQQIIDFIIQAYKDMEYPDLGLVKFSHQVEDGVLEIKIKEPKKP